MITGTSGLLVLYSTNTALKHRIQRDYLHGLHYCWCSPAFDASKLAGYARGSEMPPSSDPCSIYRDLAQAVKRRDEHSSKIGDQKKTLTALALRLADRGKISSDDRDEIVTIVAKASFTDWRPLIYIIPFQSVKERLQAVPRERRASNEMEYIVEDLRDEEFHIIEFAA